MAVVADVANIDLVVEPHTYTDEDLAAFRAAVEQLRQNVDASEAIEEANRTMLHRVANRCADRRHGGA